MDPRPSGWAAVLENEKDTTLMAIRVWRPVGEEMLGWEPVPERLGPQAPGWAVQENENDTRLCLEGPGKSICCSSVRSPTSSHRQTFQIKWEVYFFKEVFARLYSLRQYVFCKYMCIYAYSLYGSIQHLPHQKKKQNKKRTPQHSSSIPILQVLFRPVS